MPVRWAIEAYLVQKLEQKSEDTPYRFKFAYTCSSLLLRPIKGSTCRIVKCSNTCKTRQIKQNRCTVQSNTAVLPYGGLLPNQSDAMQERPFSPKTLHCNVCSNLKTIVQPLYSNAECSEGATLRFYTCKENQLICSATLYQGVLSRFITLQSIAQPYHTPQSKKQLSHVAKVFKTQCYFTHGLSFIHPVLALNW